MTVCERYGHYYVVDENEQSHLICIDCHVDYYLDEEEIEAAARLAYEREQWRQESGQNG